MEPYDHLKIEEKQQKLWAKHKLFETKENAKKEKCYVLDMFPYPSGEGLHVGHPKGYVATDVYSRFKHMQGFNVLHPMGWDAFGLPAENYAIKTKTHPRDAVMGNIKRYKEQLELMGFNYDWTREINTTDPEYYRWTQWIFLKMFEKGLAFESHEPINWCPSCQTGLANEDLEDGKCERCGSDVELKPLRQWVLRITDYADRLLNDLDTLDLWPDSIKESQRNWIGKKIVDGKVTYNLRDWVFSRQRYWGEPIPLIHCEKCGVVAVPEKDLPVKLPDVEHYEPTGTGESPLAAIAEWVDVDCPKCGGAAKRETNTMPQWAGSCWYYLRYMDPENKDALVDPKKEKCWAPVDVYVGGAEHATRHLIYARFWHKFLYDIGVVSTTEPFKRLHNVGLILAEDGKKMSKRYGNVINPDDVIKLYGADTFRVYEMFIGPFNQSSSWDTKSIIGSRRFIERIWRLREKISDHSSNLDDKTESLFHQTIKKVSLDIENFSFNTAISSLMILVSSFESDEHISKEVYEALLKVVSPFAPHVTDELWTAIGNKGSIYTSSWPQHDESKIKQDTFTLVIQVNGKLRKSVEVSSSITEEEATTLAMEQKELKKWLNEATIKKIIFVPRKLINIVT